MNCHFHNRIKAVKILELMFNNIIGKYPLCETCLEAYE